MKLIEAKNELELLVHNEKLNVKQRNAVKRALMEVQITLDNGDGFDDE